MHVEQMLATHPHVKGAVNTALARCIEACFDCAQVCASCADACLGEAKVAELVQCIRLNMDCADVCLTTGLIATRRSGGDVPLIDAQLRACQLACARCAAECEQHAEMHEHCAICAAACRDCEQACQAALASLADGQSAAH
ncbi:four-helix bundle copper-binding protein [Caulobacter segnis]|uniref:Four-helix bundle copper-binding protein n=1 Tax=Caulobacter segnis TaxID=88688 RepID=A0A2W5V5S8_9CAUL|nr:four-helix bundle copper-binding protein [Caulobacter segnis]PZR35190.1 MAG: four-helix bundle copper-binding protein [Caulobacter segnis]